MSTQYNGEPQNTLGNLPAFVAIASTTNTNPITVNTASAHGMTTGDYVDIEAHQTNTAANGVWPVTVTGLSSYTIPVAGIAAGGATGTSQSLALGPTYAIPSDGDAGGASSVNVAFEALGDRTAALAVATGKSKNAGSFQITINSDSNTLWAQQTGVIAAWQPASVPRILTISGAMPGDLITIDWSMTGAVDLTGSATLGLFGLLMSQTAPGGSPGAYSKIAGSNQGVTPSASLVYPMTLRARFLVTSGNVPVAGSTLNVTPGFYAVSSGGTGFTLQGDSYVEAVIWRPTGLLQ